MKKCDASPSKRLTVNTGWLRLSGCLAVVLALYLPAHAQTAPEITPSLKKMLASLPIAESKDKIQGLIGALRETSCGGKLTGCYMTQSGPLQLYFFTSGQIQQTLLLVVDKTMPLPHLLGEKVQKVMGTTTLRSPIISISTTDYALDLVKMPPSLQQVIRESYFNVSSLAFSSGVQLAARANLAGGIKTAMESVGVKSDELTIRVAVVLPIPSDLAGGASAGVGAAQHAQTMEKAAKDADLPEAFLEFQFGPNARLNMISPPMVLTDATFFINNALTFGYKGNAVYKGAENRKIIIHFQTPWNPAGALDLLDFQFRLATPPVFTLEDAAHVMFAMATPDPRLAKYGGGYIRNIDTYKNALLSVTTPLSVFQLNNPNPAEYRFGDSTKPFPNDPKYFNYAILGPLADGGPYMRAAGEIKILGQKMGWLDARAGGDGLAGDVGAEVTLKLGPLGNVKLKMDASIIVNAGKQDIGLSGNFGGQKISVILSGSTMTIAMNASCVNPFEIKTKVAIKADSDIAKIFEGQGGVNVDPSKIQGCIGKELEAAYKKIAGEYTNLSGYTASAANAELNKISNAAAAEAKRAAEEAQKAAADAQREYNRVKDAARSKASSTINDASKAFTNAGNAIGGIGKKKKHSSKPDAKFDRSVFNWDYYYDRYPDLRPYDLIWHWRDHGFDEGRQASLEFSAKWYLQHYPDLQKNLGDYAGVLWQWVNYGIAEGRQASPDYSVRAYLARYPDLQRAFGKDNYEAAFDHWMDNGKAEGRDGRP